MTDSAARLCVLSSSSSGNCSVVRARDAAGVERTILVDAGLSPRRTRILLAEIGLAGVVPDAVVLTHLDIDHWNPGWVAAMPETTTVFIHRRHRARAERSGMAYLRTGVFDGEFEPLPGIRAKSVLLGHDDLGCAAFRFEFACGASLGYVTDAGAPTPEMCDHVAGVDVLAIESNYCPAMQLASSRPDFLKHRIMGGKGHLSNAQSAAAVRRIGPRSDVVLLHLSRQCNTPEAARREYAGCPRRLTIAGHDAPTPWVPIVPGESPELKVVRYQSVLWG